MGIIIIPNMMGKVIQNSVVPVSTKQKPSPRGWCHGSHGTAWSSGCWFPCQSTWPGGTWLSSDEQKSPWCLSQIHGKSPWLARLQNHWSFWVSFYPIFFRWMVYFHGKIQLKLQKWMIWRYPYFRKPPNWKMMINQWYHNFRTHSYDGYAGCYDHGHSCLRSTDWNSFFLISPNLGNHSNDIQI